jgi:hypothetical protein
MVAVALVGSPKRIHAGVDSDRCSPAFKVTSRRTGEVAVSRTWTQQAPEAEITTVVPAGSVYVIESVPTTGAGRPLREVVGAVLLVVVEVSAEVVAVPPAVVGGGAELTLLLVDPAVDAVVADVVVVAAPVTLVAVWPAFECR